MAAATDAAPRFCRRCGWGGAPPPKPPKNQPREPEQLHPAGAAPTDGATRCGRCWRYRPGTLPWWQEHAAAGRRAESAAVAAHWLHASREPCALVRDGATYAAALARMQAERDRRREVQS